MCIYIYICIFKFGLGVDSGFQQLSAKKKPKLGPSINNKTPCPKPNPRAPLPKRKSIILFKRKNKNATLSPSNSTAPSLSFSL